MITTVGLPKHGTAAPLPVRAAHANGERLPNKGSVARRCGCRGVGERGALCRAPGTNVSSLPAAGRGAWLRACPRGALHGQGTCADVSPHLAGMATTGPPTGKGPGREAPAAGVEAEPPPPPRRRPKFEPPQSEGVGRGLLSPFWGPGKRPKECMITAVSACAIMQEGP